ncbi:hypothetical protein [Siccirubricoccus sp. G192]|uniref:hypothetical protein n=1 Tax=Siccirubricoccus sp. G192 TaxID=2849651 RepID=UPI001C2BEA2D|nr:hypothetical protein [Siccirubricoccus sp. G192]MBV1797644.1 hypothetical protein [Siccirubricoccus sp. G192]
MRGHGTGSDSRSRTPPGIPAPAARSQGTTGGVRLFKAIGPRDELTIGLTETKLQRLGSGPEVERIARTLVADGRVTAWRYIVGCAPDGGTRFAPQGQVAILRNDALRIEPYAASLPVAPPPGL